MRHLYAAAAAAALVLVAYLSTPALADHDTRTVTVNGRLLAPNEIVTAEQMTGYQIPSGHYWYDASSGLWGVVGGPPVGRVNNTYSQGSGTGENYGNGAGAYRNPNTGTGVITNPNGGGNWRDQVWVSPR